MPTKKPGSGWGWAVAAAVAAAAAVVGLVAKKKADDEEAAARQAASEERRKVHDLVNGAVMRLAAAFRVSAPPTVLDDTVANAQSDGTRIAVNPRWFRGLLGVVCTDPVCEVAVAHGVLGHEMTHHVNGDALVPEWIRDRHDQELRADFFAGRALALFGDDIAALERVLAATCTPDNTPTHPGFPDRLRAARAGFDYQAGLGSQPVSVA